MKQPLAFVIDDQEDNIRMFGEILRIAHYDIASAMDGLEAINWLELNTPPALIILDVNLPKIDGLEVYRYLRRKEKFNQSPIVIVTANSYMANIVQVELIEGDSVFLKPVDLTKLHDLAKKVRQQIV